MPTSCFTIDDQYGCYFITFTTVGSVDVFTRKRLRDLVISSLKYCIDHKGLILYGYVIMSNHIHIIARATKESTGISSILRDFKKFTSTRIIKFVLNNTLERRGEWLEVIFRYHAKYNSNNTTYQVWTQRNYSKATIFPKFTMQKLNYIHNNPVKAGIVDSSVDYPYSSARNYDLRTDILLPVTLLDFGASEGFLYMPNF